MPSDNSKNRRRLLKALAGAGGVYTAGKVLPETWTKPVVDALTLPAHAQTSVTYFGTETIEIAALSPPADNPILDLIVPTAHAQISPLALICVTPAGTSALVAVLLQGVFATPPGTGVLYSGMVPVGGGTTNLPDVDVPTGCIVKKETCSCRLDNLNGTADGALFLGSDPLVSFSIPLAPCDMLDAGECDISEDDTDIAKPGP